MEISSTIISSVLIGIFILGIIFGAVLTHDYFYRKSENWCNEQLSLYIEKTKPRYNNTFENSISWGIANGKS